MTTATAVKLAGMTIAVDSLETQADFYSKVFGAELSRRGDAVWSGTMAGLDFQLCTKAIAHITSSPTLHQLRFIVPSLQETFDATIAAGGQQTDGPREYKTWLIGAISDPEGNSIELAQPN